MAAMATSNTTETLYQSNSTSTSDSANFTVPAGCVVPEFGDFVPWDNPDNLVSSETEQLVDMLVAVVSLNILFFISAPTNIVNMIVFYKQGLKERINLCLFALSYADLSFMLLNFLIYLHRTTSFFTEHFRGPLVKFILNNYLAGLGGFYWASGFMTMVIACERCFCVVSPLKSQTILQTKFTAVIIVVSFVVIIGGFFPVGGRWNVVCMFDPITKTVSDELYPGQFYLEHSQLIDTLEGTVYGLALPSVYIVVTVIANAVIIVKLRNMASWRESTSSTTTTAREVNLTRMLVGTSILFVICSIPNTLVCILTLAISEFGMSGKYYNIYNLSFSVTEFFTYVNASCNFFVYYYMGSKYKQTVENMFRRCTRSKATAPEKKPVSLSTETDSSRIFQ